MRLRPLVLAMSGALIVPVQAAEESTTNPVDTAEAIQVIGDKLPPLPEPATPPSDSVPTGKAATADTASLLQDLPGVNLSGAGGVSSLPVIHGMADDRVRTLVNGMDLTSSCPNHMNPALSYFDPRQVGEVQVYAGVTPVSVGGDSIGGSVVVETEKPRFAANNETLTEAEVGGFYRSNGHARGTHANATFATDQVSVRYDGAASESANYHAADDFKDFIETGRPGHALPKDEVGSTAYEAINQSLSLALQQDIHLLELQASHQNIPFENFPNQRMDMTGNKSDQLNLRYTQEREWGLWRAQVFQEKTRHEMDFGDDKRFWYGAASAGGFPYSPIGMSCASGMPMETEGETLGVKLGTDIALTDQDVLRLGMEYVAYDLDDFWPPSGGMMSPGTFWNIRDGERDRYAVFAEWDATFSEQWQSSMGLRHELVRMDAGDAEGYNTSAMAMGNQYADMMAFNARNHQQTDENWDATFLVRFVPDANARYEVALAQKTRSPNLYERYTWSTWTMAAVMNNFVGDGNGYVGTVDLDPEVARTLSLSADWHDADQKRWQLTVTPYSTWVENYIDAVCNDVCVEEQFNVLRYTNQTARLYGVDVSGRVALVDSAQGGSLTLGGLIDYTRGKNEDSRDDLYNIMPLNEKLMLTHSLGGWSSVFEAQHVSAKEDVSDVRNEIATKSYTLYNLRSRYEWQQVQLEVGVENLFDKFYSLPLGGAYVGQGTTMSINGVPWGIAVPGAGRSIYTALSISI